MEHISSQGLSVHQFLSRVWAWMAAGLTVTAVTAWAVATYTPYTVMLATNGWKLLAVILIQLALVMALSSAQMMLSYGVAAGCFLLYAALNGLIFSALVYVYAPQAIVQAGAGAAALFLIMSFWGRVTRIQLAGYSTYLTVGLVGLIVASLVNMWWANTGLDALITYGGIGLFCVLIAYDMQRLVALHSMCYRDMPGACPEHMTLLGALMLYLDVFNVFLYMLRLQDRNR